MTTLALEFSSERRGVAVVHGDRVLAALADEGARASRPFDAIARVLAEAGVERGDVTRLAIGIGPGSHTGIRIAIAIAQGWSLATPVTLHGVDAFATLHAPLAAAGDVDPVTFAIDAQRGEFAVRTWTGSDWDGPAGLLSGLELERRLARGERILGPAPAHGTVPWVGAGQPGLCPDAAWVGRLAGGVAAVPAGQLTAVHLRPTAFAKAPPARVLDLPDAGS